jgi:hypothetical protein
MRLTTPRLATAAAASLLTTGVLAMAGPASASGCSTGTGGSGTSSCDAPCLSVTAPRRPAAAGLSFPLIGGTAVAAVAALLAGWAFLLRSGQAPQARQRTVRWRADA